jgi:hypothetical protein
MDMTFDLTLDLIDILLEVAVFLAGGGSGWFLRTKIPQKED